MWMPSPGRKVTTQNSYPANATLQDVELELVRRGDGRLRLKQALQPLLHLFDFILIDTPPTLGIFM